MNEKRIAAQIEQRRHVNADGSKVIYDLTGGVDYSSERRVLDVIASTLWERDFRAAWILKDGKMTFSPKYDVEVWLPPSLGFNADRTARQIEKDMEKGGMMKDMYDYVFKKVHEDPGTGDFLLYGQFISLFFSSLKNRSMEKEEIADLFRQMSQHLRVKI